MALVSIAMGAVMVWSMLSETVEYIRRRSHLISALALVVDHEDASARPGVVRRSAVFRVTTADGQSFDVTSSASTYPGPKVGSLIPVRYDPERPWKAERTGVITFKLWIALPLTALGVFLIVGGVRHLL